MVNGRVALNRGLEERFTLLAQIVRLGVRATTASCSLLYFPCIRTRQLLKLHLLGAHDTDFVLNTARSSDVLRLCVLLHAAVVLLLLR